jgi:hypothetical protein
MGAYDESEHERREKKVGAVTPRTDDDRVNYEGQLEFDAGESAEALLNQFRQIKSDTGP